MEVSAQIKKYRTGMDLSQEELADKIFVTRQTISNWENDKSYPDIHSLLLLSSLFDVSLDQLMKGDIETMKEEIKEVEIQKMQHYGSVYTVLLIVMMVSALPLFTWLGFYGAIPWGIIVAVTLFYSWKVEQIKKDNDVQTYKEIVAFKEGRRLDEMERQQELGKRPYQRALLVLGSAAAGMVVVILIGVIMHFVLK